MRVLIAAAALLVAFPVHAYNEALHGLLTQRALEAHGEWRSQTLQPPTAADLAALRALFWKTASKVEDPSLKKYFLKRFPTAASLDAWGFKEFLMLDPAATVHGLDLTADDGKPMNRVELLALASRWPDDDARNRNRFFRDGKREVALASDGTNMPYDPMTLALGKLQGGTSQGHAHYGLSSVPYSDDPEVLKKDPRHFAIPPDIRAFGQDVAQLYSDLSLLAAGAGLPSSQWLSVVHAGASFHHLEDVANQIHTVQVGIYDFFEAAYLQSTMRDVATLGGLFGPRRSLREVGLRLVANHHLLLEDLFARRVQEAAAGKAVSPEIKAAVEGITKDDPAFAPAVAQAIKLAGERPEAGPFARTLCDALVESSSVEAPEIYQLAWAFSAKTLHDGAGHEYKSPPDDPDQFLAPETPERAARLRRFWELEGRGLTRAGTVLRAWQAEHDKAAPEAEDLREHIVRRMLAQLLPYHLAAAERRAKYVPAGPDEQHVALGYPLAALALLVLIAFVVLRIRRKV